MAQQDTPAAGSGKTQAQQRLAYTFAINAIQTDRALERIEAMGAAARRKAKYRATTTTGALWAAQFALEYELEKHLANAQSDGLLLTCWRGSEVEQFANHPGLPA